MNGRKYKYKDFEDFWKNVKKNGVAVFMEVDELEAWSKTVFNKARETHEK